MAVVDILHLMWCTMVVGAILFACLTGRSAEVLKAALDGMGKAIEVTFSLAAGYLLFCGLAEIMKALRIPEKISRLLQPLLNVLMPHCRVAGEHIALNLSMNMLGAGNAATPPGIKAMQLLSQAEEQTPQMRHDRYMLLILNATSVQLIPTSMLALRTAAGSAEPNAILLPTLICTGASTLTGVILGLVCREREKRRNGRKPRDLTVDDGTSDHGGVEKTARI